ncbi:MAG: pilus assembly PilX N-terminal domain-containing protein [Desulfobacteraceae bacterium]|nr:pilus assembly PilX N-terminal domain-containing protein [Desulfobacteraceae bacterium]
MTKTFMKNLSVIDNETGSAMVLALIVLAALTIIGIFSINTSTIETQIDTNDRLHKMAFYEADGGTEVAREMIEQNIACTPAGFQTEPLTIGSLVVENKDFAFSENAPAATYPSDTQRDMQFPADDTQPHTNIVVFGNTQLSTGSALQMAAGYEGKGKGAAGGGGRIVYNVHSKHENPARSSSSHIRTVYRHMIGQEGDCKY